MIDKKLTPLHTLLKEVKDKLMFLPPANAMSDYAKGKQLALQDVEELIKSLLPKEIEFARDMWQGGYNRGFEEADDNGFVGKKLRTSDFITLYKQYE